MIHLNIFPLTFPVLLMFEVRKVSDEVRERLRSKESENCALLPSTLPWKFNILDFLFHPLNSALQRGALIRCGENAPKMCSPNEFCGMSHPSGKSAREFKKCFTSAMFLKNLLVSVRHSSVNLCHSFSEVE